MILPPYKILPSQIADAGKGLFVAAAVARGSVIIAPDNIHTVWPEQKLRGYAADSIEVESSVRWFENYFSLTPEWSDECYVNHSFTPNGLWHLGFIFAQEDLAAGTELTIDYRCVIGSGERLPFTDAASGREIVGLPWRDNLRLSAQQLLELLAPTT
ncbi:MAG: hypothetical protein JWR16_317 [Nevskia sp.]|nr:hypothetical protein [Nevskia sp.]